MRDKDIIHLRRAKNNFENITKKTTTKENLKIVNIKKTITKKKNRVVKEIRINHQVMTILNKLFNQTKKIPLKRTKQNKKFQVIQIKFQTSQFRKTILIVNFMRIVKKLRNLKK